MHQAPSVAAAFTTAIAATPSFTKAAATSTPCLHMQQHHVDVRSLDRPGGHQQDHVRGCVHQATARTTAVSTTLTSTVPTPISIATTFAATTTTTPTAAATDDDHTPV